MRTALRYALLFLVAFALFSTLFFLPMVAGTPEHVIAAPCSPPSVSSSVVIHLTEEDFAAHPALYDLIVEGKKVRRPTPLFFLPPPGDDWSAIVLNRDEDLALSWDYMQARSVNGTVVSAVIEYNGTYYRLAPSQG